MCEIDTAAKKILRRHFPNVPLYDDVRKVGIATHERKSVDIICGGFPCQDLSVAGKRAGLAGERSGLWFKFARIIDELEPLGFVIENVPGLLSSDKGRDFAVIIQWLAERGYGVAWRVLDAQYFGLAQRRKRVFIVGSLGDGRAAQVLFERESGAGDPAPSRKPREDVASTIGANSPSRRNGGSDPTAGSFVVGTLAASGAGLSRPWGQGNELDFVIPVREIAQSLTGQNHTGLGGGQTNSSLPNLVMAHGQANAEIVSDGSPSLTLNHEAPILFAFDANRDALTNDENIAPTLSHGSDGDKAHGAYSKISVAGKFQQAAETNQLAWDAAQITSKQHGSRPSAISQPLNTLSGMMVGVRRLTPTEAERLQGFPDGWTDGQSDSARYRQLGNAVAVPVLEWIGKRIKGNMQSRGG